jgi:hypothetical protein
MTVLTNNLFNQPHITPVNIPFPINPKWAGSWPLNKKKVFPCLVY